MAIGQLKSAKFNKDNNELTMVVKVDPKGEPSSTGKMNLMYTSGGWTNMNVEGLDKEVKFNFSLGYKNGRG